MYYVAVHNRLYLYELQCLTFINTLKKLAYEYG